MTLRHEWLMAVPLALAFTLAACGGGSDEAASPPPAPPAVAAPPPTPQAVPPFPSATPSTFYTGPRASAHGPASIQRLAEGKMAVTGISRLEFSTESLGSMNLAYLGRNNYSIELFGWGGPIFLPGEHDATDDLFDIFRKPELRGSVESWADNLELAKKSVGVSLTYATFGSSTTLTSLNQGTSYDASISFFTAGSITPYGQIATTGSGEFTGIADGFWFDGTTWRRLYGSLATGAANFDTREITLMLDLRGYADPFGDFSTAPTTTFGTFGGMGAIPMSNPVGSMGTVPLSYARGDFIATAGYSGQFSGQFYGPSANEFGVSFRLTGPANQTAFGVVVFKRN